MGFLGRSKSRPQTVTGTVVAQGGPVPKVGDIFVLGSGTQVPILLDQGDVPGSLVDLAEMTLDHLGKARTDENMLEATALLYRMISAAAVWVFNGFCSSPSALETFNSEFEGHGESSLAWARSLASATPRGDDVWDFEVMKAYSMCASPEGILANL